MLFNMQDGNIACRECLKIGKVIKEKGKKKLRGWKFI